MDKKEVIEGVRSLIAKYEGPRWDLYEALFTEAEKWWSDMLELEQGQALAQWQDKYGDKENGERE